MFCALLIEATGHALQFQQPPSPMVYVASLIITLRLCFNLLSCLPMQEGCVPLQVPSYWQYRLVEPTRTRGVLQEKETEDR